MTDAPNTPSPDLQTLTTRLETTLLSPEEAAPRDAEILDEQVQILDQLFALIVGEKISPAFSGQRYDGETVRAWLAFALQIQKQTTATLKAKAAIDYMNTLTRPHVPKIEKRTGEAQNA